jgi:hypothetical protein
MPLSRLTREELRNTLKELLGIPAPGADALPTDHRGPSGFLEAGVVSAIDVDRQLSLVAAIGQTATPMLPALVACDPVARGEDECIRGFITSFGRRAYRRPLAAAEVATLAAYYKSTRTAVASSFLDGARLVLQAMLLSPNFLYRWELGPQPATAQANVIKLTAHELASRPSYFRWGSMPDAALFAAADGGRMLTAADLEREARRMLASPRAPADQPHQRGRRAHHRSAPLRPRRLLRRRHQDRPLRCEGCSAAASRPSRTLCGASSGRRSGSSRLRRCLPRRRTRRNRRDLRRR